MSTATIELGHAQGRHRASVGEVVSEVTEAVASSLARLEASRPRWDDGKFLRHTAARIHSHRRHSTILAITKVSLTLVGLMISAAL